MNVDDRSQLPSTIYAAGELTISTRFPVWGNCNSWFWSWTMSSAHLLKLSFIPSRLSDFSPFSCLYFHCLSAQQLTWLGTWTVRLVLNPSIQFSCSAVSDSFWPHGLQHARPPCPSPTPGANSNSCPSSRWCHPNISPSVIPFSSCLQSFPASGSFPTNQHLNHYCLLITLRASPACQPGHLHSTQASSFAARRGPFEGISPSSAGSWAQLCSGAFRRVAP